MNREAWRGAALPLVRASTLLQAQGIASTTNSELESPCHAWTYQDTAAGQHILLREVRFTRAFQNSFPFFSFFCSSCACMPPEVRNGLRGFFVHVMLDAVENVLCVAQVLLTKDFTFCNKILPRSFAISYVFKVRSGP